MIVRFATSLVVVKTETDDGFARGFLENRLQLSRCIVGRISTKDNEGLDVTRLVGFDQLLHAIGISAVGKLEIFERLAHGAKVFVE